MEDITQMKIDIKVVQTDVKYIKESLDSHIAKENETIERLEKSFENFLDKASQKFASKWIEKLVYSLIIITATALIGLFVKVITNPTTTLTQAQVQEMIQQNNSKYFK